MERRDFLQSAGQLALLGALVPAAVLGAPAPALGGAPAPVLLPPLPPLDHKGDMDIRVWVRSGMTGGVYSCVECAVAPRKMGPAPHYHQELDELMFVLEGTASVLVGDQVVTVPAGGWHLRPRQLKHTFWNGADQPLRFVDMYFNQPFEEYLERVFHELTPEKGYVRGSDAWRREMSQLSQRFGLMRPPHADEERAAIVKQYGLS